MKQKVFFVTLVGVGTALAAGSLPAQQVTPMEYPKPHTREGRPWNHGEVFKRVLAEQGKNYKVHPATQAPENLVTPDDIRRWEKELSNWGRWGEDDTRGALNLITPAKTKQAAGLVREGRVVSLQHFVELKPTIDGWRFWPAERWITSVDPLTGVPRVGAALDAIRFSTHEGTMSHLDAICHYERRTPMADIDPNYRVGYNGHRNRRDELSCQGESGIMGMGKAYVTRGVIVDIPRMRGLPWLEPSTPIFIKDLEEWERQSGVKISEGDALMVRTGRWAKREAEGPWDYAAGGAGLHASVLPWLRERGVAILIGDAVSDVQPSGVAEIGRPVHTISMVVMGLPTVDNGYLEDVARVAAELNRWEMMVSWQIPQSLGGTAVPFNALATF